MYRTFTQDPLDRDKKVEDIHTGPTGQGQEGRGNPHRVPEALITMLSKPMYVFPIARVYVQVRGAVSVLPTAVQ